MQTRRPSFEQPPVTEVAVGVQFDRPTTLSFLEVALLREHFVERFPDYSQHPERPPMTLDRTAEASLIIRGADASYGINAWFVDDSGQFLVQLQSDRIVLNWRKTNDDPYPRYEDSIRPAFQWCWTRLKAGLDQLGYGPITPGMCEVSYVNPIEGGTIWESHAEASRIFTSVSDHRTPEHVGELRFDGELIDVTSTSRYRFPGHDGILVASFNPVRRADNGMTAYMFELSARLPIAEADDDAVMAALDLGRDWIVTGFAALTTTEMGSVWQRV